MGTVIYFVYNTLEEAQAAADLVNANYVEPQPINQGHSRHGVHPVSVYCNPVECVEGWAVIADKFTSQYINIAPQEITFQNAQI